jgi:hypothetical protein
MRADYPSQLIKLSKGENICLQDTTLLHDHIDPCLLTIWGTVGNRAWVELGFKVYYFDIHLHTTCIPLKVYSSMLSQRQVGTSNIYIHLLLEGEEEKQEDKNERVLNNFDAVVQQLVSKLTTL